MFLMNPVAPFNTTGKSGLSRHVYSKLMPFEVLFNNYFGRQFNSLNDVVINPRNGELYFTDTLYGFLQDFRPPPGLRNQVYRYNFKSGAIAVVADDFTLPNGEPVSYALAMGLAND